MISRRRGTLSKRCRATLGPLEARVMRVLWEIEECSVREVQQLLHRKIAYTTVLTTLDRLFHKKLVKRRVQGQSFIYTPKGSREQFARLVAENTLRQYLRTPNSSRELLLSCLVKGLVRHDTRLVANVDHALRPSKGAKNGDSRTSDRL